MIKICPKCGKEFDDYSKWGPKKFCSRKCANSKVFSEESRKKKSEANKGKSSPRKGKFLQNSKWIEVEEVECPICRTKIKRKNAKTCSKSCSNKNRIVTPEYRLSQSELVKEQYKNGRKVYGGNNHVPWYEYKNIKVQGTWELKFCTLLDLWKQDSLIIDWEYTNDRFEYIGIDNKKHTYLLDFKIIKNNSEITYIEIKGRLSKVDSLKWDAVRNNGYQLLVLKENNLKNIFKKYNIPF